MSSDDDDANRPVTRGATSSPSAVFNGSRSPGPMNRASATPNPTAQTFGSPSPGSSPSRSSSASAGSESTPHRVSVARVGGSKV